MKKKTNTKKDDKKKELFKIGDPSKDNMRNLLRSKRTREKDNCFFVK